MGAIASQIASLTIVYSTVNSDADHRKRQSSASLAFVRGIHRGPVNSPHKWPVTREMLPFDDVIMNFVVILTVWHQSILFHVYAVFVIIMVAIRASMIHTLSLSIPSIAMYQVTTAKYWIKWRAWNESNAHYSDVTWASQINGTLTYQYEFELYRCKILVVLTRNLESLIRTSVHWKNILVHCHIMRSSFEIFTLIVIVPEFF